MLGPKIYSKKEPKRNITQKSNLLPKIVLKLYLSQLTNIGGDIIPWLVS